MATRDGRLERGMATGRRITASAIDEIRTARTSVGLSRRDLGRTVGLSEDRIGRFERGELDDVGLAFVSRLAAAVGLEASLRFFPTGDAARDAGQLRLLERLRIRLPTALALQVEVPVAGRTDLRAWDAVVAPPGCRDAIEAETRLGDVQATERRIALKLRDDPAIHHVVMLVADTRANRQVLAAARSSLVAMFPVDGRAALARLAMGRCPEGNAIVVL